MNLSPETKLDILAAIVAVLPLVLMACGWAERWAAKRWPVGDEQ